jgi:hypothetical protein
LLHPQVQRPFSRPAPDKTLQGMAASFNPQQERGGSTLFVSGPVLA